MCALLLNSHNLHVLSTAQPKNQGSRSKHHRHSAHIEGHFVGRNAIFSQPWHICIHLHEAAVQ